MRSSTDTHRPLLDTEELARLQRITLQQRDRRRLTHASYAGAHRTALRGHGMELHDVRPYQPGDDIRHMDWRATARSGRATSKVFVEERGRSLFLIVDRRPSMMFGTRRELKAATAARAAAIHAFSALAEREAVAGVVLEDRPQLYPPARTVEGVLPLLHAAAAPPYHGPRQRDAGARFELPPLVARRAGRGATVCMISDFDDVADGRAALADYLPPGGAGYALAAVRVVDPAEEHLEDTGVMRLISPATGEPTWVDTGNARLRERYRAHMAQRAARLQALCRRHGIALTVITNSGDTVRQLGPLP